MKAIRKVLCTDRRNSSPTLHANSRSAVGNNHSSPCLSTKSQYPVGVSAWLTIAILFLSFIPSVRADGGDEFANNLFSDLAPILALFGEQVTKQFLSESSGLADCILFAMAPLGVITAIVSVIRVAGHSWLKAIVGRSKEGRALAELELMSSNSPDVGEMWNGKAIIRVLGTPSIFEFVYDPEDAKDNPTESISILADGNPFFERIPKANSVVLSSQLSNPQNRWDMDRDHLEMSLLDGSDSPVREIDEISPPNISINARGTVISNFEKWSLAIIGVVVQLLVLIYEGLISYHPSWRTRFLKNGSSPSPRAFPCTAAGTLSLNIAMFACSYIIDCASVEEDWRRTSTQGPEYSETRNCRVAWVQKGGTVNDQSFRPYTIFGHEGQEVITTSRRCSEAKLAQLRYWVVLSTFVSVGGFVVQFIGLRGMHWSATIAQLVATGVLTILRSFFRRHMLREPTASPAVEGYELDSMARLIGQCNCWKIISNKPTIPATDIGPDSGLCNKVLQIRKRLGELSQWPTGVQDAAISLCDAIEQTMNTIYEFKDIHVREDAKTKTELRWNLRVLTIPRKAKDNPHKPHEKHYGELEFKASKIPSWKPWELCEDSKSDIVGALSLWMLHVMEQDILYPEDQLCFGEEDSRIGIDACAKVLVWPNHKIDQEIFKLWQGFNEAEIHFEFPKMIALQRKPPKHRFIGERTLDASDLTDTTTVAIIRNTSVEKHLAQQIFSDFFSEVVTFIDRIGGETTIHHDEQSDQQEIRNSALTRLVERISETGLGTRSEILLILLSHLGKHEKLPEPQTEPKGKVTAPDNTLRRTDLSRLFTERRQRLFRANSNWLQVAQNIQALITFHEWQPSLDTQKLESWSSWQMATRFCKRMLALGQEAIAELEVAFVDPLEILKSPETSVSEKSDNPRYTRSLSWLHEVNSDKLPQIPETHRFQEFTGSFLKVINGLKTQSLDEKMHRLLAPFGPAHAISINDGEISLLKRTLSIITREESVDILRVASRKGYDSVIEALIDKNIDVRCTDNIVESPLFLAASAGHIAVVQLMLDQLQINFPEDYELFHSGYQPLPLIIAAINGHNSMVRLLLTHSPGSLHTNHQDYALILAARNGHRSLVAELLSSRDHIHIHIDAVLGTDAERALRAALMQACAVFVNSDISAFMDNAAPLQNPQDTDTKELSNVLYVGTALQAAVKGGHLEIVQRLIKSGAKINSTQIHEGKSTLNIAAELGNLEIVDELLNKDGNKRAIVDGTPWTGTRGGRTALQAASEKGHLHIVNRLLEADADVNAKAWPDCGRTALQAAAGAGHLAIVERLLEKSADITAPPASSGGRRALQAAAGGGYINIVELLLERKLSEADERPRIYETGGRTALQAAAEGGHLAVVKRLLISRATVNAKPSPGARRTALQAAAEIGHLAIVDALLETGADVNAEPLESELEGRTALQAAAGGQAPDGDGRYIEVVERLIESGANVNAKPAKQDGRTALQAAAGAGNLGVVEMLLKARAHVNSDPATYHGRTALQAAAEGGYLEVVQFLLAKNAHVNAPPAVDNGRTALQAAAGRGSLPIVKLLLQKGANVNTGAPKLGRTALQAAAEENHVDVVNLLLKSGADVNAKPATRNGRTALQAAAGRGHLEMAKLLLDKGANVNELPAPYGGGRTALQAAAECGSLGVVDILLRYGGDVNAKPAEWDGRTALQVAAENGHMEVLILLLKNGADVIRKQRLSYEWTSLQLAAGRGHLAAVRLLLEYGADVNAHPAPDQGSTALQAAAQGGHIDVLRFLIKNDGNVNARAAPTNGITALEGARRGAYKDIVDELYRCGAVDIQVRRYTTIEETSTSSSDKKSTNSGAHRWSRFRKHLSSSS